MNESGNPMFVTPLPARPGTGNGHCPAPDELQHEPRESIPGKRPIVSEEHPEEGPSMKRPRTDSDQQASTTQMRNEILGRPTMIDLTGDDDDVVVPMLPVKRIRVKIPPVKMTDIDDTEEAKITFLREELVFIFRRGAAQMIAGTSLRRTLEDMSSVAKDADRAVMLSRYKTSWHRALVASRKVLQRELDDDEKFLEEQGRTEKIDRLNECIKEDKTRLECADHNIEILKDLIAWLRKH